MKLPRVIIFESDGWITKQLRELAGESRWLVQTARSAATALTLACERRAAVLVIQVEPAEDKPETLRLIADAHRLAPDVSVVAVSDVKLPEGERAAWTAALLDLGARYVLFPPLMKVVLEDVVSGLMTATIRSFGGEVTAIRTGEEIIDLAAGGTEA
jgi:hypothetical protein